MKRRNFIKSALVSPVLISSFSEISQVNPLIVDNKQFVINAGVGGNNTVDLLARIDKDCLSHVPDLTIMTVGTNDMNSRKFIPLEIYQNNLNQIINKITSAGSQIVLTTLLPAYEPYLMTRHPAEFYQPEGYTGRLEQMNDLMKNIAVNHDLPILDLHHIFSKLGNISESADSWMKNEINSGVKDGLHPTPVGYKFMAVAMYEFIIQTGLPHKRIVCFGDSITAGDGGVEGKSYPAFLKSLLQY